MSLKAKELSILAAVAQQCAETRRPISSLIVMAACNARSGVEQDKVLVHLGSLKRQGYITQDGERWEVTPEGHQAARQHITRAATPSAEPEPIPERPPVRPKSRDTLRPRVGVAPKPVTRPDPLGARDNESRRREPRPEPKPAGAGASSTACDDQWAEDRADAIGQNGNDGLHYAAQGKRQAPTLPMDLLHRCAAMNMALMADARRRYEASGCREALAEISWLSETGRQLLKAGGGQ